MLHEGTKNDNTKLWWFVKSQQREREGTLWITPPEYDNGKLVEDSKEKVEIPNKQVQSMFTQDDRNDIS